MPYFQSIDAKAAAGGVKKTQARGRGGEPQLKAF